MLLLTLLVAVIGAFFPTETNATEVCGRVGPIWRNSNHTCPEHAVCGDVFENYRDWRNGTRCYEKRLLSNCLCPGQTVCPFDNPNHVLYTSGTQTSYMCEQACSLPWCNSVITPGRQMAQGDDPMHMSAMTSEQSSSEFAGNTYYKMRCRCPQHVTPFPGNRRAVSAFYYNQTVVPRRVRIFYSCNQDWGHNVILDPCFFQNLWSDFNFPFP